MNKSTREPRQAWSRVEVERIVASYLHMLKLELAGQRYNKSAHRRILISQLDNRTEQSVELKHQNISAVLKELGAPWIFGYKPLGNFQHLLWEVVADNWLSDPQIDEIAIAALEKPAIEPMLPNYEGLSVLPPTLRALMAQEPHPYVRPAKGFKRDYLKLEANNRSLGLAGEAFILAYERYRLLQYKEPRLADKVEHVAATKGDGLGYDILSFEPSGKERLIEVKTTSLGHEAPFYITGNELKLSKAEPEHFKLCRLYNFRRQPKMFELTGAITNHCQLDPVSFIAKFH